MNPRLSAGDPLRALCARLVQADGVIWVTMNLPRAAGQAELRRQGIRGGTVNTHNEALPNKVPELTDNAVREALGLPADEVREAPAPSNSAATAIVLNADAIAEALDSGFEENKPSPIKLTLTEDEPAAPPPRPRICDALEALDNIERILGLGKYSDDPEIKDKILDSLSRSPDIDAFAALDNIERALGLGKYSTDTTNKDELSTPQPELPPLDPWVSFLQRVEEALRHDPVKMVDPTDAEIASYEDRINKRTLKPEEINLILTHKKCMARIKTNVEHLSHWQIKYIGLYNTTKIAKTWLEIQYNLIKLTILESKLWFEHRFGQRKGQHDRF